MRGMWVLAVLLAGCITQDSDAPEEVGGLESTALGDEMQTELGDCDRPVRPRASDESVQVGVETYLVTVTVLLEGRVPVPDLDVYAADVRIELPASVFDYNPFFSECGLAAAQTDANGTARLHLGAGAVHLIADSFVHDVGGESLRLTEEIVQGQRINGPTAVEIWVYRAHHPFRMNITVPEHQAVHVGDVTVFENRPAPITVEVRFDEDDAVNGAYMRRMAGFSGDACLWWTNQEESWVELWPIVRVGDQAISGEGNDYLPFFGLDTPMGEVWECSSGARAHEYRCRAAEEGVFVEVQVKDSGEIFVEQTPVEVTMGGRFAGVMVGSFSVTSC